MGLSVGSLPLIVHFQLLIVYYGRTGSLGQDRFYIIMSGLAYVIAIFYRCSR